MTTPPEPAIRLARAAFNQALANADLSAIGRILAPTALLVTGTDSALLTGRKAQLAAWRREFAAPTRTIYVRQPDMITMSPIEPIAFEQGQWRGTAAGSDTLVAAGIYTAKWRKTGPDWVIEAELYLTLR